MSRARRQELAPTRLPPGPLEPELLAVIELLAQADAERDYRAAKTSQGDSREDGSLRPL